jgi:hypothetical protein
VRKIEAEAHHLHEVEKSAKAAKHLSSRSWASSSFSSRSSP